MAIRKAITDAQKIRAKDLRIQRKFGITLADRDRRAEEQGHKCKVCGGPLEAYGPPNIDHYHFHVTVFRSYDLIGKSMGWRANAYSESGEVSHSGWAKTKAEAIKNVRAVMMPFSIRGLLCFKCNKGLGYIERFFGAAQNPDILLSVREYLRKRLTSA